MCLAVPLKLVSVEGKNGVGEFEGIGRRVRLDFVPAALPGDYVLVHAGFAIEIVQAEQAEAERRDYAEVIHAAP